MADGWAETLWMGLSVEQHGLRGFSGDSCPLPCGEGKAMSGRASMLGADNIRAWQNMQQPG